MGPRVWQADERGDGWINLHQLLAMRSVTLYFDRLQARQGGPPPTPLQMGAPASHAGVRSPRELGPVSPRAQIERILADADSQAQQARAALDELARREQEEVEAGGKTQAELEAAISREARSEAAATARLAREGEDRARWEAELQERITRTLQATVQQQLQELKGEEPPAAAAGAKQEALEKLEAEHSEAVSHLQDQHQHETATLYAELDALREQLHMNAASVAEAEAEADVRVATQQARHEEELRELHRKVSQADGELTARRAAETRAKLELRSRRDGDGGKVAADERAARAREFQDAIGLSPRGEPRTPRRTVADGAHVAPLSMAPLGSTPVAPPATTPGVGAKPVAPLSGTRTEDGADGVRCTPSRYDDMTPRSGARAAQRDAISAIEEQVMDSEQDWTPRGPLATGTPAAVSPAAEESTARVRALPFPSSRQAEKTALRSELQQAKQELKQARARSPVADLTQLQADARSAARDSAARSTEAREALARGDLNLATKLAKQAEADSTLARQKRREAEALNLKMQRERAQNPPPTAASRLHKTEAGLCSDADTGIEPQASPRLAVPMASAQSAVPALQLAGIAGNGAARAPELKQKPKPSARFGFGKRRSADDLMTAEQRI
tara:strand:+ start:1080 stop:2948 length:1869 start_codon:yes stop_codon:yes gene_type:complete